MKLNLILFYFLFFISHAALAECEFFETSDDEDCEFEYVNPQTNTKLTGRLKVESGIGKALSYNGNEQYFDMQLVNLAAYEDVSTSAENDLFSLFLRMFSKSEKFGIAYLELDVNGTESIKNTLFSYEWDGTDNKWDLNRIGATDDLPYSLSNPIVFNGGKIEGRVVLKTWEGDENISFVKKLLSNVTPDIIPDDLDINEAEIAVMLVDSLIPREKKSETIKFQLKPNTIKNEYIEFKLISENDTVVDFIKLKINPIKGLFSSEDNLKVSALYDHLSDKRYKNKKAELSSWEQSIRAESLKIKAEGKSSLIAKVQAFDLFSSTLPLNRYDRALLLAGVLHEWVDPKWTSDKCVGNKSCILMTDYRGLSSADVEVVKKTKWNLRGESCDSWPCNKFTEFLAKSITSASRESAAKNYLDDTFQIYINGDWEKSMTKSEYAKQFIIEYDRSFEEIVVGSGRKYKFLINKDKKKDKQLKIRIHEKDANGDYKTTKFYNHNIEFGVSIDEANESISVYRVNITKYPEEIASTQQANP